MFTRERIDYEDCFPEISAIQFVEYTKGWRCCYGAETAEAAYKMATRRNGGRPMMLAKFIDHYYAWTQR